MRKYRDRNGRCIAILFKSIGVRGRFEPPDLWETDSYPVLVLGGIALSLGFRNFGHWGWGWGWGRPPKEFPHSSSVLESLDMDQSAILSGFDLMSAVWVHLVPLRL